MCPATLAIVGAAASAGGAVLGGINAAQAAGFQAQIASNNATIARQNAQYSAKAGAAQTEQAGLKARAEQANLKAAQAAQGVDVNTGSAEDVQQSQRELGLLDTQTVAGRAAQTVYGYQQQATSFQAQSRLDTSEEGPDIFGGVLKGAGSLLSGAADLPSGFGWMKPGGGGSLDDEDLAGAAPNDLGG